MMAKLLLAGVGLVATLVVIWQAESGRLGPAAGAAGRHRPDRAMPRGRMTPGDGRIR